jgi:23S rRNA (adenine2503-C2)-methyltransferase
MNNTAFYPNIFIPLLEFDICIKKNIDILVDRKIIKPELYNFIKLGELWYNATGRKPFFNYCAHEKNASDADVDRLLSLFDVKIWEATVSVICEREQGFNKSNDRQRNLATGFASLLVEAGYNVRVFDPAGQDTIGGGCGQLPHYQNWVQNNPNAIPSCGMKYEKVHAPMLKG